MLNRGQTSQQQHGLSQHCGWAHFHLLAQTQKVSTDHVHQILVANHAKNIHGGNENITLLLTSSGLPA